MIQSPDSGRQVRCGGGRLATVLFVASASALSVLHAKAADWSVISDLSQKLEYDDNFELDVDSPGYALSPTSTASLGITANAPTYTIDLGGGLSYREFTGPGEPDNPRPLSENLDASVELRGPRHKLAGNASFARRGVTFTEAIEDVDDLGVDTVDTDSTSYSVGATASVDVNRSNSVTFAGSYRIQDFGASDSDLVPFDNLDVAATWTQDVTADMQATLRANYGLFNADDDQNSENQTYAVSAGVNKLVNSRLTVSASVGVNVNQSREETAGVVSQDTSIGPIFDVGLEYVLGVTAMSLSLSQSVNASAVGDLQERRTVSFGLSHQVNSHETFRLASDFTMRDTASSGAGGSASTTFLNVTPSYSFVLSRSWSFEVGYQFRYQDGGTGIGTSNRVFGTLTRNFVILP